MKAYRKLVLLLIVLLMLSEGNLAQRFLLVKRTDKYKNYKYFEGDIISLSAFDDSLNVSGSITCITQKVIIIGDKHSIPISQINSISRPRRLLSFASKGIVLLGLTYFTLTGFNRTINHESPIYDKTSLLTSAGLLAGSYITGLFSRRKIVPGENWEIMMIDLE